MAKAPKRSDKKIVCLMIMDDVEYNKVADSLGEADYLETGVLTKDMASYFAVKVIKKMLPKMSGSWVRRLWEND